MTSENDQLAKIAERLDAIELAVVLAAFRQAQTRYELQQLGVLPVPSNAEPEQQPL